MLPQQPGVAPVGPPGDVEQVAGDQDEVEGEARKDDRTILGFTTHEGGACCVPDPVFKLDVLRLRDGTIDANEFGIIASTNRFDHCVFTVKADLDGAAEQRWLEALFAMRYDEPSHREMMDLEGLKAWLPGRTTGFAALAAAVDAEGFFAIAEPAV